MRLIVYIWVMKEIQFVDGTLKRVDHWVGAVALIVAIVGIAVA